MTEQGLVNTILIGFTFYTIIALLFAFEELEENKQDELDETKEAVKWVRNYLQKEKERRPL